MPITKTCDRCKGEGSYDGLVSQHDDATERVVCGKCNGKGVVHEMTEKEENDYWENYE
jgi:DnaJ-class molecular chaperone